MRYTKIRLGLVVLIAFLASGCAKSRPYVDPRVLERKGIESGSTEHRIIQDDLQRIRDARGK
jgi:hypothetical protein